MHADAERWNRKYLAHDGPRRFEVEPLLERHLHLLGEPGQGLELACGTGAHSLWLGARGWQMTGVDVSVEGLRIAGEEARRRGVELRRVVADALRPPIAPGTRFDLIVTVRFLERALFPWIGAMLAPGGRLFYATFNMGRLEGHPQFNPHYLLERGELRSAFADLQVLAGDDGEEMSWVVVRRDLP
jgi:SAM-dependent methyltransferase